MTDASTPAIWRRLIEAIDADVPIDDVIEDDTEFQVFLSGQLVKALRACADALAPAPLDPMVEAQLQKEIAGALKERREIYDQAPATYGSEQGRWSYLAQCNASHLADLVQRLSTLRGAPEPKWLTRDDCIALENLCTAKARAVRDSSPDDADEFRRLMQKVLRLRADALAPPEPQGWKRSLFERIVAYRRASVDIPLNRSDWELHSPVELLQKDFNAKAAFVELMLFICHGIAERELEAVIAAPPRADAPPETSI